MSTNSIFEDMLEGENKIVPVTSTSTSTSTIMIYSTDSSTFAAEDTMPPFLRLGQGLSAEVQEGVAKPGQWLLSGYPPQDSLGVMPLMAAKKRELREEEASGNIMCESSDSLTGVGDPGGICATCAMSQWSGEGKKRYPPKCSFYYSYIVYINEHDTFAVLNFKKTALNTARVLNSLLVRKGYKNVVVILTAQQKSGPRGSYYIPSISSASDDIVSEMMEKCKNQVI